MKPSLSRAGVLKWIALAPAIAAGAVTSLTQGAQAADNKKQFKYVDKSTTKGQTCANCHLFKKPASCSLVTGKISPAGWCVAWSKK
jgi:hypothetical protein